jgi:CHAD domain-containing protein
MAKLWAVRGLDCSGDFASNARRVIAARIAELYSHVPVIEHPEDAVGLHEMRIAVKRLRYSLEFFAVCFDPTELEWFLTSLSGLQELIGNLHDADEFIPHLHQVLGEIEEHRALEADAVRHKDSEGVSVESTPSARYVPGLLSAIRRMREQRESSYTDARALWLRLESEGFRERLVRLAAGSASEGGTT